ncbi:cellobiose phosphorylase [Parasphingopyxis algicola]|uniref:GH36-type glycosyl hydrolase domain-containing protein n=1 Tax=Parasphingopyxis algicola TaxID=2026624 RepID=UPI0015A476A8|nr:glucoamylase family protein [Parasphingopyxis algicola]QLC26483.1 cellobiose phosphorylase [Parasphingopyxis algicola]
MADESPDLSWSLVSSAETLSGDHALADKPATPIPAWDALSQTQGWLHDVRLACVDPPPDATKAAEWLLDNDYQIHRALRQIKQDLPRRFYDRLPALAGEEFGGTPRVFSMAHDLLRVTRLQISLTSAVRYVRAYQHGQPLLIAELWAFPTMLRIACLEVLVSAFSQLIDSGLGKPFAPSQWAEDPHSLDATERVARAIANLGVIAAIPWKDFFDQTSRVEEILRDDPSDHYRRMDFESRDQYRHAVEELARYGTAREVDVAAEAVRQARSVRHGGSAGHVGHWLVGDRRRQLEERLTVRLPPGDRARRHVLAHPGAYYAFVLSICIAGALILPAAYLYLVGADLFGWIAGLALASVPSTVLAVTFVHWGITQLLPPRTLYKLDCSERLPRDARTIVAIPVIVPSPDEVSRLVEQAETHWLANADPRLQVALLADLADAEHERMPGDAEIESALEQEIRALNDRHGRNGTGPFHLLVRPRLHNAAQGCWMAWERKRGKLEQFNRLLVDGDFSPFSIHAGSRAGLEAIRFVITVDADTMLPPGSVGRLVGALAHPLNTARIDEETGRVTAGYSIVQPRVEISPQSGMRSLFARLFTGDTAIDIYSRAVSDVYQDLFGAGIFVGKGIYDVRAFHRSVDGRVPENRILSHDLFEGAHGRVALATDIVLYEGFPASYLEYAERLHRWIRGDWQLLAWLWRSVPAADGSRVRNPLAGIDRWKIIDNLRRSLIAPSLLVLALAGWMILPGQPWFWTLLVVFAPGGQLVTDLVSGLARGRRRGAARDILSRLSDQTGRWLLAIVYLPHEALLSFHAVAITLWRLVITRRRLLEWTTAAHVAAQLAGQGTRIAIWRRMWLAPVVALAMGVLLLLVRPTALPAALPLLLLWIAAPEITVRIGAARTSEFMPLDADDRLFLRALARRTWFYFETFAGPEDNWLPPDNYQGEPHEEVAHRTSPTNIGMMLLSTATAWDFGYIGRTELAARTDNALQSLARLERYRGHLFNWYDTQSLKPLEPRYVSTVDSGNLAVSLIAYAETLREAAESEILEPQQWSGLSDVLDLLDEAVRGLPDRDTRIRSRLAALRGRLAALETDPDARLAGLTAICDTDIPAIESLISQIVAPPASVPAEVLQSIYGWIDRLRYQLRSLLRDLRGGHPDGTHLRQLADQCVAQAYAMDFAPLYDEERGLFHIGHNVSSGRLDQNHYDLLASEARLASFFAIAKRDVPLEHWFHLGRPITRVDGSLALISWNGSMFEYLMPRLVLQSAVETLLGESERTAVEIQQRYGRSSNVPWGISESAYSARDPDHRYRYQAFGAPGLGLRRGLARDMVVAPYASALALAVAPADAAANLRALSELGAGGRFGLFEAVDFTADRAGRDAAFTPVIAYMAHHQGMILCAINNALRRDILVRRLNRDPRINLISLLLSERLPREEPSEIERLEELERPIEGDGMVQAVAPWRPAPSPFPQTHLLGNGRLSSWISDGGGGGLRWRKNAMTRFVPDAALDADGLWLYILDAETGALWSATRQPTGARPDEYDVLFHAHMAEFHRRDHQIETRLEVAVAAGDDLEIRRVTVTNESERRRTLRLTSYAEVVLAPPLEDERHPAFSKLFVCSEPVPHLGGLLFTRRARDPRETPPVLLQFLVDAEGPVEDLRYETDRRAVIGRNRSVRDPAGARSDLANGQGCTLDPVAALQIEVALQPYERRELCYVTVAAATREAAIEIAERYTTLSSIDWALGDAASDMLRAIGRSLREEGDPAAMQMLGSLLVYPHPALRADLAAQGANRLGQPGLWGMALSGDLPILLLRVRSEGPFLLERLLAMHEFWRRQGLEVDLVVLQVGGSGYVEPLRDEIMELLRDLGVSELLGRNGGIHLLFADQIGSDQVRLLEAVARVILDEADGTIEEQLQRATEMAPELPRFVPSMPPQSFEQAPVERRADLLFDNGFGGFSPDGREYVMHLEPGAATPAPWTNILANEDFGCLVTESGGGFTWAVNSGENRLTPSTNDPVADRPVETLYLRDEETAAVWTVTPSPKGPGEACEARHGAGYSEWYTVAHGLAQEMRVLVPPDAPVKIVRLRVRNPGERHRRLTATYYAEWLLGSLPSVGRAHVVCDYDTASHTLFARSAWNPDFAERVAFLTASEPPHGFTTDRGEFLGREGDPARPAALDRWGLSGTITGGAASCAAYQVHVDLAPGEAKDVVFVIGQGRDRKQAQSLAKEWAAIDAAEQALAAVQNRWDGLLGAVEVRTPDPAFDLIVNRWLLYQSLSSRVLARAGFYQASGAIGFRDQLQDVLALLFADPDRARAHILSCAEHQFEEGDVLHWWHPPSGRGVRTRCSDDLLWLPYAVGTYVAATGDLSILTEEARFLDAPPLAAEEHDRYARFDRTIARRPLIDHCERALEQALTQGAHGLPLIGGGDWNDGMDRVGDGGHGESVWLAWFAAVTAGHVADLNRRLGRNHTVERWRRHARDLVERAEAAGWDGDWYRRAYDDEGHPLGSAQNSECRIDSISQSWALFAGADAARVERALHAARDQLLDAEHGVARLLWPPFDRTLQNPGYIKSYPPGIRENGGQYSHAAAWLGIAFARSGDVDTALAIFHMLNPVTRASTRDKATRYLVEPYAVAADIASGDAHGGRGGWTWYTGAAAWTWRLAVEEILGLGLRDGKLCIAPKIPAAWDGFEATLRRPEGSISVRVERREGPQDRAPDLIVDGEPRRGRPVAFPTDGSCRTVTVLLGGGKTPDA